MSFKTYTLGEVASNTSRRFNFNNKEQVCFVNTGDILDGHFLVDEKVSSIGLPGQAKKAIQKGDILYSEIRPGNKRHLLVNRDVEDYVVSTKFMVVTCNQDIVIPEYLYLVLTSKECEAEFKVIADSRSGTFPQITFDAVAYYPIELPSLIQQRAVVEFIESITGKLNLNNLTNQTLEEMAQAIFKSWFVDFDPVKAKIDGEQPEGMDEATASLFPDKLVESELGLIPEGWKVGDLSDLMDFNPKRTLKKGTVAPYLDMKNMPTSGHLALDIYDREMGSGTKFMNGDSLLARITPCLENGKTAYVDFLEDKQVGWGSTEYIVMRSKSDSYKYFSYYMARFEPFRKFAIQSMTGTSGRQRAQAQTVQTMPFAIPPISILEKFDGFVASNMQMIKSHGSENRTLAALRDTLLPKLLSGEIELGAELQINQ